MKKIDREELKEIMHNNLSSNGSTIALLKVIVKILNKQDEIIDKLNKKGRKNNGKDKKRRITRING